MENTPLLKPDSRVIMISGASRGIGAAIARKLMAEGYRLSLGVRSPETLHASFDQQQLSGTLVCHFEAQDPATATNWVKETHRTYGRIDGLINNAGILRQVNFETGNESDLDDMWSINVKAPFRLTKLCLPYLREAPNGRIINIASTDGKRYRDTVSVGYTMVKHALVAMSHGARFAGWDDGVRVTALCPGAVDTDLVANIPGVTPAGERLSPHLVAAMVSTVLSLPNTASVAELPLNTRLESSL